MSDKWIKILCGKLYTGLEARFLEHAEILVHGQYIEEVGSNLPCPEGTEILDLSHLTVTPGMKVLPFAFDARESNNYLPYTYVKNCVVYTGTHDNDTLHGWTLSAAPEDVRYAKEYIDYSTDRGSLERQLIRIAMASVGDTVIIPIQDWLELGSEARINQPSTLGCNWLWRMNTGACTSALANEISRMTELYGR